MLRLYVMRHAKSSWAIPGTSDFDRGLNERGISDLGSIARQIRERKFQPSQILCSPAVRTRQTLEHIRDAFTENPEISYPQRLYSSGLSDYMELLQGLQDPAPAMIIGHNPMCANLVMALSGTGDEEALAAISMKYPTSTISIIDFKFNSWRNIKKSNGNLRECILVKTLRAL